MRNKKSRYELVLAGSGGQGLIVTGMILGEAAILDGRNVVQTVNYGIASRGGFSKAEVIIDNDEIIFQGVEQPDIVLVLTEEAMEIYRPLADPDVFVFYDSTLLKEHKGAGLYGFPFTATAEGLGNIGSTNVVALGAISILTGCVQTESLIEVIKRKFSGKAQAVNLEALHKGLEMVIS